MLARLIAALLLAACARAVSPGEGTSQTTMTPTMTPTMTTTMQVPAGAWQRDWISRHGGPHEATVTVRYVQTPSVFADLRIPAERAGLAGATSFDELSDEQLAVLARQNGFAGFTTMAGADATWHHEIDFQPADDGVDIGRIERVAEDRMFEHALDGAYVESWSMLGGPGGDRFLAVRVARGDRVEHVLSVAGSHFVYARAREVALPAGRSITELIARAHATRAAIVGWLDCEISYGRTDGWRVERSTLPWREGKRLGFADRIAIAGDGRPVARDAAAGEVWSFPVARWPAAELRALFAAAR